MATNPLPLRPQDAINDGYLLETFLTATPDHVYFKDTESRFTRVSASFARWVGIADADEAVGLPTPTSSLPPTLPQRVPTS